MSHPIYIIVAVDQNNGIGIGGHLPWRLKKEYKYFRETTKKTNDPSKQNMVIMGRRTWESLASAYRPLPQRKNVVLSHDLDYKANGALICPSFEEALNLADDKIEKIFILGGGTVFAEAINHPDLAGIYLTRVYEIFDCDTFFPKIPEKFSTTKKMGVEEEDGIRYEYFLYKKT